MPAIALTLSTFILHDMTERSGENDCDFECVNKASELEQSKLDLNKTAKLPNWINLIVE